MLIKKLTEPAPTAERIALSTQRVPGATGPIKVQTPGAEHNDQVVEVLQSTVAKSPEYSLRFKSVLIKFRECCFREIDRCVNP